MKHLLPLLVVMLISCQGPVGPQGPAGPAGEPGSGTVEKKQRTGNFNLYKNNAYYDVFNGRYGNLNINDISFEQSYFLRGSLQYCRGNIAPFSCYDYAFIIRYQGIHPILPDSVFVLCGNDLYYGKIKIDSISILSDSTIIDTVYLSYILNLNENDVKF